MRTTVAEDTMNVGIVLCLISICWIDLSAAQQETAPTPVLSPDHCPEGEHVKNGYSLERYNASCRCEKSSSGFQGGSLQWFNASSGEAIGQPSTDPNTLVFTAEIDSSFICKGIHDNGTVSDKAVTFTPDIAYGPKYFEMDSLVSPFQYCVGSNNSLTLRCLSGDVAPGSIMEMGASGLAQARLYTEIHTPKGNGTQLQVWPIEYGTILNMYCRVRNEMFPSSTGVSVKSYNVSIEVVGKTLPVIKYNGTEYAKDVSVDVMEGKMVEFKCIYKESLSGSTPRNDISCLCGTSTTPQTAVDTFAFTPSRTNSPCRCGCTTTLKDGCQSVTTTVNFVTRWLPESKEFTANSEHELTVDVGTNVTFRYTYIPGSPDSSIFQIQSPDGNKKNFIRFAGQKDGSVVAWETRQLRCEDGGTYACMSHADWTNETEPWHHNVTVNVRCPIENPESIPVRFEVESDEPTIIIPFVGFPDPSDVELYKVKDDSDTSKDQPLKIESTISRNNSRAEAVINIKVLRDNNPALEGDYLLLVSNAAQQGNPAQMRFHLEKNDSDGGHAVAIGVGVGVGVVVIIAIVVAVVLLRKRSYRKGSF